MNDSRAKRLEAACGALELGNDGIWSAVVLDDGQASERALRARVALQSHDDYLGDIARHHSIPVMDHEVRRFLDTLPCDAMVIDVGGCWGWHWRHIARQRPDVCVIIVDFVRENLHHAIRVLGPLVGAQVALVHGDAKALPFADGTFDAFWTVQTFQHVPNFRLACQEAFRVMKAGPFINYSLHSAPLVRLAYAVFRRHFHVEGDVAGRYYLARANESQRQTLADVFQAPVKARYTECLFHPDLKLTFTGAERSRLGTIDARLDDLSPTARWLARQCAFEVWKMPSQDAPSSR